MTPEGVLSLDPNFGTRIGVYATFPQANFLLESILK